MNHFDIVIVGGGIAGASLGAEVASERTTLIIEAEDQCGYHSTGRSAAFYLESYGGPKVAPLTIASGEFLENPPAEFSDRGFLYRRGALHLSNDGWPELPDGVEGRRVERAELERLVPGVRPQWSKAVLEPGCADIDVAGLHAAFLRRFRRFGGEVRTSAELVSGRRSAESWILELADGERVGASIVVNAAGAWVDHVALACGAQPLGFEPKRRTLVQARVDRCGLKALPLVDDWEGSFYFKGEGDNSVWLSPHDEIASPACDAAPEEIDIATAIDRFEGAVDWRIERVERSWAGLRTFAPDRIPVYGYDPDVPGFFWCAGQGGFGIQTSPAAAKLAAAVLLDHELPESLSQIDPTAFSPKRFR